MNITNLKESIEALRELNKNNSARFDKETDLLEYNIEEGSISKEWYEAILEEVKKYKPKRVIDIGSNINLFGYLFANEGIEYIGIDNWKDVEPIQTEMIKFIEADYYEVREKFSKDICISCLCVGYLIPIEDVKCKRLIINSNKGTLQNFKCTAKEYIYNKDTNKMEEIKDEISKIRRTLQKLYRKMF